MSDNEGISPEQTPAASAQDASTTDGATPANQSAQATLAAPATSATPTGNTPTPSASPASTPVPPRPPLPANTAGSGQAAKQPALPAYAGVPYPTPGASFGQAAQSQPTLPMNQGIRQPAPKKKSGAGKVVGLLVAAALVGGAAGLGGTYAGMSLWGTTASGASSSPSVVTVNDADNVNTATAVATKVLPSVVTISASSGSSGGTGSGVVLSDDGYILTNTHVVTLDGATADPTLSVTTSDGSVYSATVVGIDPTYDLAVIKLDNATGLTPIDFADSSDLNVGETAIAVGAPLGLSNTVTTGIVSALNRSIEIASSAAPEDNSDSSGPDQSPQQEEGQSPFQFDFGQGESQGSNTTTSTIKIAVIQTDAAINPGNSGGALVDSDGKLIGINVAIASSGSTSDGQSGNIGVGFAIPSNVAERVANELIENGTATHGLLGALVQDASSVEGATTEGAYISEVTDAGAAAAGGLQAGDVVTSFNGVPVSDSVDLTAQVRAAAAGSDATVTIVRNGNTQTLDVTLGALE
ncbi:putative serine protease PepD [Microbacterium halimionae]|uniref:Putative serine protease PepD n=1 Tax=Microbacterium halimionae TaxID=1526413 RepID=A0A7W3PMV2_9MICO|nr:trypsin-like peptidase domain-containing protein [Microbacterium halimionae]MBA8817347.1 putative serine protease PepD [Microbacterium halimionae]NII95981.1 putative serine protease PepD [Microbacterium halimionae]